MSISLKDEVRDAALGDQRLTKRLGELIEQLGAKPNRSVPRPQLRVDLRTERMEIRLHDCSQKRATIESTILE